MASTAAIGARMGRDPGGALKNLLRRMVRDGAAEQQWFRYGLTVDGTPATMEQARTASASRTLRGAGCYGFRITGGQAGGSNADTGVDQAASEPLYARLFPGGQGDVERWAAKWGELTAAGYPATCADPETLLAVARVCRGARVP